MRCLVSRREGHVEADDVRGGEQLGQLAPLGAGRRRGGRAGREEQLHLEPLQQLGHPAGDAPEAHEADGGAGQLASQEFLGTPSRPPEAADERIALGDTSRRPPASARRRARPSRWTERPACWWRERLGPARRRGRCCRSRRRSSRRPSTTCPAASRRSRSTGMLGLATIAAAPGACSRSHPASGRSPPASTAKRCSEQVEARRRQRSGHHDPRPGRHRATVPADRAAKIMPTG